MREWEFDDIVCVVFLLVCVVFFTAQIIRWAL